MTVPLNLIPAPHDASPLTLVDQLVQWARRRIDERVFRPGMRMPSIRKLALDKSVSRFTVVEAYERLVAQGYLDSRRGSGFYVRERTADGRKDLRYPDAPEPLAVAVYDNHTHLEIADGDSPLTLAEQLDIPTVRLIKSRQARKQGRFAAPGRPHHRDEFARVQLQTDAAKRKGFGFRHMKELVEIESLQDGHVIATGSFSI